eukprot:TRINITY_DN10737_c0_g1_i1.p2 TRINITY_DN10737_c0_g1~~TRINITY_DN10737_c0_g1_i1.p2  ORF type:complete len:427 (-),score=103.10 TRINITY_DN10737_c0_g1_i1:1553-2710(-)
MDDGTASYGALAVSSAYYSTLANGTQLRAPDSWVMPYYGNLAMAAALRATPSLDAPTRELVLERARIYLDWYFANLNSAAEDPWGVACTVFDFQVHADGSIKCDTKKVEGKTVCFYDSSDSYAATLLSLMLAYVENGGSLSYASSHSENLHCIAEVIEATYQDSLQMTWGTAWYQVAMLMDNAEVWAGLNDYVTLLSDYLGDSSLAAYYANLRGSIASGVETKLYLSADTAYKPNNEADGCDWDVWYADATANVWPLLFGVPQTKAVDTARNTKLFNKLVDHHGDAWLALEVDDFPWVSVQVAAHMCDRDDLAATYEHNLVAKYSPEWNYPYDIAEAGWHVQWFASVNQTMFSQGHYPHESAAQQNMARPLLLLYPLVLAPVVLW